jgi:hypothetical protein
MFQKELQLFPECHDSRGRTSAMSVAIIFDKLATIHSMNSFGTNCAFSHEVKENVEPSGKVCTAHLSKVHSGNGSQFDA